MLRTPSDSLTVLICYVNNSTFPWCSVFLRHAKPAVRSFMSLHYYGGRVMGYDASIVSLLIPFIHVYKHVSPWHSRYGVLVEIGEIYLT